MEKLTPEYSTDALAAALEVSESGFAAHRRKARRPRRQHDEQLRPLILQSFEQSRHTYGCLRVRLDLQDRGQHCGKNRIARLMRESGLRPRQKRRFRPRTPDSRHPQAHRRKLAGQGAHTGSAWPRLAERLYLPRDRRRLALPRLHP